MAQPPLLTLSDIALTFGSTPLLESANLMVYPRERLCLVGRNGSGKSTLMKVAAGLVEQDKGDRFVKPGISWRYLPQEPDLSAFETSREYIADGLVGADDGGRIPYLLDALGLTGEEDPKVMSGGEMRRAALARTLAPDPDILMLDEPTNHLDLPAIEWLEEELSRSQSAILLISHDRRFLESLSRRTVWMDRGETRDLDKGFGAFEDWRDEFLEQEELERHKMERKVHREQHWVVHGVSGRRKRNVRRLKELGDLRKTIKNQRQVTGSASITVTEADTSSKQSLPSNFLILDEPTNDLDLETLDLLQEMVANYNGTVIIVSHDRDFLDRTVTRTLAYEGPGDWQVYAGGYSDMIAQRGIGVEARKAKKDAVSKTKKESTSEDKKSNNKLSYKHKFRLEKLPKEMDALETQIANYEKAISDPELYSKNPDEFAKVSKALETAQTNLSEAEEEWLELEMLKEEMNS